MNVLWVMISHVASRNPANTWGIQYHLKRQSGTKLLATREVSSDVEGLGVKYSQIKRLGQSSEAE